MSLKTNMVVLCSFLRTLSMLGNVEAAELSQCGAAVPFTTYEAEDIESSGKMITMKELPAPNVASPEMEASGRCYVKLASVGDYCEIPEAGAGNAIVLRYSIPDAPLGGGTTATLSLYINSKFRQKLILDSRHNWLYGKASDPHGGQFTEPSAGGGRVYWNDTRFLLGEGWQEGDVVRLQKDADDTGEYYGIDLVDLEMAPPPLEPPSADTFLSIADFGATANDTSDDTAAIRACVEAAKSQKKIVWFPAGTFFQSEMFALDGVQVQGAGMWHTQLIGTKPSLGFMLAGHKPRVADMFIESTVHHTRNDPGGMIFRSRSTKEWSVENVWMTHMHCGFWLGQASHGSIRGCRIYCTYADAINLNRGSSHNIIEHNYVRGAGDDGIASLSLAEHGKLLTVNNTIRFNTIIANWWGHNIDIAGGSRHVVENNYLADNSHSGCFTFNLPSAYPMHPLASTIVRRNTIVRGGGNHAGQQRGAVWSFADDSPIVGVVFEENKILAPIFRGLHLHGGAKQEIEFKNNLIEAPGIDAVRIDHTVRGRLTMNGNEIRNLKPGYSVIDNAAGEEFQLIERESKLD